MAGTEVEAVQGQAVMVTWGGEKVLAFDLTLPLARKLDVALRLTARAHALEKADQITG